MRFSVGDRLGRYEIVAALGAGGMGEVYRAHDPRLCREVAIKILSAERIPDDVRRRRFAQEARAASALNHPGIVTIHEIDSKDGVDFIVMECVSGQPLSGLIPKRGMPLAEALRMAIQIASALASAHEAGIVHRDLKPANVMVTREGAVKVLDFGLAKLLGEDSTDSGDTTTAFTRPAALTAPGSIAGTAAYMSPEQATGGRVDARSDIFSFGAVLYEMVTGQRAFGGKTASETLTAIVREQPRPPRDLVSTLPGALERLVLLCLRKEADRRMQHMSDVRVELQDIQERLDAGRDGRAVPSRRRRALWLTVGVPTLVALVALGWLWPRWHVRAHAASLKQMTATSGDEIFPSLSPDGNQVAFAWKGESGDNWDIYVKMIGSAESHRLTTDPAADVLPSWSPDGRQIAFVRTASESSSTGTIHVVSPLGGFDRKVSEQTVSRSRLSWSPDGRWLVFGFDPRASDTAKEGRGISLVDVATGEVRPVSSPTPPAMERAPAFSPDGSHLAYFSCRRAQDCELDVVPLGRDFLPRGPARTLTPGRFWPYGLAWARDCKSVIYGDQITRRLHRVPIDGSSPPEAIEIAGLGAQLPATAAGRDRLVFERVATAQNIYRFEPEHPSEAVVASASWDWEPDLSPEGDRLVWTSQRGGDAGEIWLSRADGRDQVQLTHGPGLRQSSPRWSPDGRRVAFDSFSESDGWDVWTVDADGGPPHRVTSSPGRDNLPSWSHDGRYLYFTSDRTGTPTVWRIPAAGGSEEQLTHKGGGRSAEAPDGRTLYFQASSFLPSPLMAVSLTSGEERTVVKCVRLHSYAVTAAGVLYVGCEGDEQHGPLVLLDPDSGRRRTLGTLERPSVGLTASRDGKVVLFTKAVGTGIDLMLIEDFR